MAEMFVLLLYMNGNIKEYMGHWEDPKTGEWTKTEGNSPCAKKIKQHLKDLKASRHANTRCLFHDKLISLR